MSCCGSHENKGHEHHSENHEDKKNSWFVWIIVLLMIGLLVFSLLR
jgi:hypothetical protein